ncbi:MAG: F-box protein [Cytophagaceae bacterium]|nr:MAG: F-box protein [Cytophagaceae bacterium]
MRLPSFPKKTNERRPKGGAEKQQRDSTTEPSTTSPTAESRAPTEILDLILEHSDPAALSAAMEVSAKWRSSAQDPRMLQRKLQEFPGHKAISPRRPRPAGIDFDTNALVQDLKAKVDFESLVVQKKFKTIKVQPALDWFETTVQLSSEAKYLTLRRRHEFIEQGPDQPRAIDMRDWIYKEELWDVSKPSPKLIKFPDPNVNRHPRFTMRGTEPKTRSYGGSLRTKSRSCSPGTVQVDAGQGRMTSFSYRKVLIFWHGTEMANVSF